MLPLIVVMIFVLIIILFLRYDPLYTYINKKRDPKNFRKRVFFEKKFWENFKNKEKENPFRIIKEINTNPDNKNIISYSLYGNNPKYYKFLESNYEYVSKNLDEWKIRIYLHDKVDKKYLDIIKEKDIEVFIVEDNEIVPGNSAGAFWRFLPICEPINAVILDIDDYIRDNNIHRKIDSFFSKDNNNLFKIQSAFPWPSNHICGKGIFKKKNFIAPFEKDFIINYFHRSTFGSDEIFLSKYLYPKLDKKTLEEDFRISKYFTRNEV